MRDLVVQYVTNNNSVWSPPQCKITSYLQWRSPLNSYDLNTETVRPELWRIAMNPLKGPKGTSSK